VNFNCGSIVTLVVHLFSYEVKLYVGAVIAQ